MLFGTKTQIPLGLEPVVHTDGNRVERRPDTNVPQKSKEQRARERRIKAFVERNLKSNETA